MFSQASEGLLCKALAYAVRLLYHSYAPTESNDAAELQETVFKGIEAPTL